MFDSTSTLEAVLAGSPATREKDGRIDLLQRLAVIQVPDPKQVKEAAQALKNAEERQKAAAQTVAGKSEQLATLLDHALRFHEAHGDGPCSACGRENALDKDWHQAKAKEAADLRQAAQEATEARKAVDTAQAEIRRLMTVDWALLKRAGEAGVCHPEGAVVPSPEGSAVEETIDNLVTSLDQLKKAAAEQLQAKEDAWRPYALAVAEWLPKARKARKDAESLPNLKAAIKMPNDNIELL